MVRWDWYQATVTAATVGQVSGRLVAHPAAEMADLIPARGMHGYDHGAELRRGDHVLARLWYGGNPGINVTGSGEDAPFVAEVLAAGRTGNGWIVRPTRVDACYDKVEPDLFDRWSQALLRFAEAKGIQTNFQGDWLHSRARTLYLGSPKSTTRLVIYEKGYQLNADPAWVRLEVRVKPDRHARAKVATWQPSDAFRASRWLVQALDAIGWRTEPVDPVGTIRVPSDAERARHALITQYARTLDRWAADLGGWQALAATLQREAYVILGDKMVADPPPEAAEQAAATAGQPVKDGAGAPPPPAVAEPSLTGTQPGGGDPGRHRRCGGGSAPRATPSLT